MRLLLVFSFLWSVVCGTAAVAQPVPSLQAPAGKSKEPLPTVKLLVSPTPEPEPSLKYQLLPDVAEEEPGNAATLYYKAMASEGRDPLTEEDYIGKVRTWIEQPLDTLPVEEMEKTLAAYTTILDDVRRATRRDYCRWEEPIREHGFATLLPQIQKSRSIARVLAAKARLEIAQGKFDQAAETIKTGFALGRDLAEGETIIHALVGSASIGLLDAQIVEWIGQPGAPNLYWALSTLPRPMIGLRRGIEFERHGAEFTFHELQQLDERAMSPEEAAELAREVFRWSDHSIDPASYAGGAQLAAWALKNYSAAREYLAKRGLSEQQLESWPALQLVLLYKWKQFQDVRDDYFKWALLSDRRAADARSPAEELVKRASREGIGVPFVDYLPAVDAARQSILRGQQRIDALRVIEALRLYAAEHGRWPERLEQIGQVPVPDDPLSGEPFPYRLEGETAILEVPSADRFRSEQGRRYELTLRE